MRSAFARAVLCVLIAAACSEPVVHPSSPSAPPPAPSDAAGTAVASPIETRCNDAAPPIRVTAAAATDDLTRIPGRALFWDAGALRLLEAGRVRDLASPYPVRERTSKVTADGRVVAILGGAQSGDAHLWERSAVGGERLVKMPF